VRDADLPPDAHGVGAAVTPARGFFVVLEGPDGSGKSTVAPRVVRRLEAESFPRCVHLREPGGTAVGERIRDLLLDPSLEEMELVTETLLYIAARAELVAKVVSPALRRGEAVVCERYLLSTIVYQGVASGADPAWIRECFRPAALGVEPDLTIVLDVPAEVGLTRRGAGKDRLESRDIDFHRRVRQGFLDAVARDPERVRRVDGAAAPQAVEEAIWREVADVLGRRGRSR
jgi:dTMP kinase